MTSHEILKADVLDILFENRNKMYGAYTLRKFYHNRLLMALAFSITAVVLLMLLLKPVEISQSPTQSEIPDVIVSTIDLPKDVTRPPQQAPTTARPQPPAAPVAQQQFTNQIKITNDPVETALPAQTDLLDVAISDVTTQGIPADALPPVAESNSTVTAVAEEQPAAATLLQAAPEFPGGAAAWAAFLSRHLQAPGALEAGEKKTVLVRFLVSTDGSITGFEVVQSGGAAFDNEVIRVLKKMPKWKPAIQNGQQVAVTFTQPVTFIGREE